MDQPIGGTCLNCGRTEQEVPLVSLRFRGEPRSICPQCLPLLIHHPERLAGKLAGLPLTGAPDDDDELP